MYASPQKPFLLLEYAKAMACVFATSVPTSLPRPRILGDPRVLNFLDLFAFEDFAIILSSSGFDDEGSPNSYQLSFESNFYSREVSVDQSGSFGCNSNLSRHCSDGSTSQST
jgi:hypothetical protein